MDFQYVLPEDRKRYSEHTWTYIMRIFQMTQKPAHLYHYTTAHGLIQIIESGSFWTMQIANVNDAREILHSIELFLQAVLRHRSTAQLSTEAVFLFDKMEEGLRKSQIDTLGVFVACFSTAYDDLNQWRAYSGGEGGYALQLNFGQLGREALSRHNALLVPVIYDPATKAQLLDDLVVNTERFFLEGIKAGRAPTTEAWAGEFIQAWSDSLTYVAPLIKHESFRHEAEWRLVYPFRDKDHSRMKFSQPRFMLRRHLPLTFADQTGGYSPLPLSGVVVGPTPHPHLCQFGVNDLLISKGYDPAIRVTVSSIPYRVT